ncbi:MAG: GNAT family N-acetyltransferase [Phycisphaerales bacterium]
MNTYADAKVEQEVVTGRAEGALVWRVLRDWSEVDAIRDEWDALSRSCGGDVYTSCDAGRVWWSHYGRGELWILEARSADGALVGVLPMFVEKRGLWGQRARIARMVGVDSTIVVTRPAVAAERRGEVVEGAARLLMREARCDGVVFGALGGESGWVEAAREGLDRGGEAVGEARVLEGGPHTVFRLPETFDAYLSGLDKRQRGNYRRDRSQLDRMGGLQVRVITEAGELERVFQQFMTMHGEQWRAEGRAGHFGDWRGSHEFSAELVRTLSREGNAGLVSLEVGGEVIGMEWFLTWGERGFWRLPARRVGEPWDKLGLGRVGLVELIGALIERGVREIEAGPGRYEYKLKHGGEEYAMRSVVGIARGSGGRRMRLLFWWSRVTHLLYYRAWRIRYAPKVGMGARPLWSGWARARL